MSNESEKPVMDEMESISCYNCGAIEVQLYLNHEVHDYAYKQMTCLPCALIWQKTRGS